MTQRLKEVRSALTRKEIHLLRDGAQTITFEMTYHRLNIKMDCFPPYKIFEHFEQT